MGGRWKDTEKWEKHHDEKRSWKTFSNNLVTFIFQSLALVSTVVAVAVRGVARILTHRVF